MRSINAEQMERCFDQLVDITDKTWNKQPEDLVKNAFLHVQAEQVVKEGSRNIQIQEREINKIAASLPKLGNLVISKASML